MTAFLYQRSITASPRSARLQDRPPGEGRARVVALVAQLAVHVVAVDLVPRVLARDVIAGREPIGHASRRTDLPRREAGGGEAFQLDADRERVDVGALPEGGAADAGIGAGVPGNV